MVRKLVLYKLNQLYLSGSLALENSHLMMGHVALQFRHAQPTSQKTQERAAYLVIGSITISTNSKQMYEALDRSGIITLRFANDADGHDVMVTEKSELVTEDVWLLGYIKDGNPRPEGDRWHVNGVFSDRGFSFATGWYEGKANE